jgi:hypothetical protein
MGALLVGPGVRRAIIGPPRPHKPSGVKLASGAALVFLATALVFGGGTLLIATLSMIDDKPLGYGVWLGGTVAVGALAIGAVLDRGTRVPKSELG